MMNPLATRVSAHARGLTPTTANLLYGYCNPHATELYKQLQENFHRSCICKFSSWFHNLWSEWYKIFSKGFHQPKGKFSTKMIDQKIRARIFLKYRNVEYLIPNNIIYSNDFIVHRVLNPTEQT
jgi:hypothetical protein